MFSTWLNWLFMGHFSFGFPFGLLNSFAFPRNVEWTISRRGILFLFGFISPFGLFNTFEIAGIQVSVLWILGALGFFFKDRNIAPICLPFLFCLFILIAKLAFGGGISIVVKYGLGIIFMIAIGKLRDFDQFFKGLLFGAAISFLYGSYQWFVVLLGSDLSSTFAEIPVQNWNSSAWHAVLTDERGIPRVPGFMYEPAYLAIIINLLMIGELLYREKSFRWKILIFCVVGSILVNSRTGIVSSLLIFLAAVLLRRNSMIALRILFASSILAPIAPLFFIFGSLLEYRSLQTEIDISIFARYISFAALSQEDPSAMVFGVVSYGEAFLRNPVFQNFSDLLEPQGANRDPKSLLAANLFSFGVLGSFILYLWQLKIFWARGRSLAMLAASNLIFFNVYAYSWPLYWLMIAIASEASRRSNVLVCNCLNFSSCLKKI